MSLTMSKIFFWKQFPMIRTLGTSYAGLNHYKSTFRHFVLPHGKRYFHRYSGNERNKFKSHLTIPVGIVSSLLAAPLVHVEDDKEGLKKAKSGEDTEVVLLIKHAILAQMKDEGEKAEMYLHRALKKADQEFSQKKLSKDEYLKAKIYIYDILANNALTKQELEKAESLFKETMKGYLESGKGKTDNAMVEMSLKLATIYAMQQRDSEAVQGFEFCINTQKEKLANDSHVDNDTKGFLGMALQGYGLYLLHRNKISLSLTMLTESLDVAKSLLGETNEQTLVIMNDLAIALLLNEDLEKADEILKSAIHNSQKSDFPVRATLYSTVGALHLARGEISETESACKKSLLLATRNSDQYAMKQANECLNKVKEFQSKSSK